MRKLLLFLLVILTNSSAKSQDIFNEENSLNYAKSLICEQAYELAEYTLFPFTKKQGNDSLQALYLHTLYQQKKVSELFNTVKQILDQPVTTKFLLNQIACICIEFDSVEIILNHLPQVEEEIALRAYLINKNYEACQNIINTPNSNVDTNFFKQIMINLVNAEKPSKQYYLMPAALIPGMGKILLGKTYEGITQMFMVGSHTYLAIYAYQKNGFTSIFGHLNLVMGTAFYLGSIIGTKNAIHRKSQSMIDKNHNELKKNLYAAYNPIICNY